LRKEAARVADKYIDGPGLVVVIGVSARACGRSSLVLSTYDDGSGIGTVGVIGPTRMHYSRAIFAVDGAAQTVSRVRDPN
jgi:transcriptional regulator of heat shock response